MEDAEVERAMYSLGDYSDADRIVLLIRSDGFESMNVELDILGDGNTREVRTTSKSSRPMFHQQ